MTYAIGFTEKATEGLSKLDKPNQVRILKKIAQLEREDIQSRHLKHGLPFFVEEAGGYRIIFEVRETEKMKTILFIGDHKEYEKWYQNK